MNDVTVYPTHCFILHFLLVAYETLEEIESQICLPFPPPSADLWNSLSKKKDSSRMLCKSWVNGRCDRQLNTEKKCRLVVARPVF